MVRAAKGRRLGLNLDAIEPLQALGIQLLTATDTEVQFRVPAQGNFNDKGTVFAGSQYSGLVIAGWYLASHWAQSQQQGEKVAIKDCQVSYPAAAMSDLTVTARFIERPDRRPSGHWRAQIRVEARDETNQVTATLIGDYRILTS